MANKFYTLMVMPEATSQIRKYHVPKALIKGLGIGAVAVVLISGALVYRYCQMSRQVALLEGYREEYNQQRVHFQTLDKTVNNFKKEVADLSKSNQKFRVMVGLPEAKNMQQVSGIGGEGETGTVQEFVKQCDDAFLKKLYAEIEAINLDIAKEQNNLQEITETVEDKKSLMVSTPAIWPVSGWITSDFGYRSSPFTNKREMHKGLDIAAPFGTSIIAPADGLVAFSGRDDGLGKSILLDHGYGYTTRYGHTSELLVRTGDRVKRGQLIARVGNTGRSTAPHLHYEVRMNGVAVNPNNYILN